MLRGCDDWLRYILRLPGPAFGRDPGTTIRSDLVGSPGRQHFVGPRPDVGIELRDLFLVEQLGPGLHGAVVAPVLHDPQKLLQRQLAVWIGQIRRQRRPNRVRSMASETVDMPPFPAVVDALIYLSRLLRGRCRLALKSGGGSHDPRQPVVEVWRRAWFARWGG